MGKDKKSKKLKRDDSEDEDLSHQFGELSIKDSSTLKKSQNMAGEETSLTSKKSKNKKNKSVTFDEETANKQNQNDSSHKASKTTLPPENLSEVVTTSKKKQKKKVTLDVESDEEPLQASNNTRAKAGFAMLASFEDENDSLPSSNDDDDDDEPPVKSKASKPEPIIEPPSKQDEKGGKKSKKKERKKKKEDDEEIDKLLEELALEHKGVKPTETLKNEEKTEENKVEKPTKRKEELKQNQIEEKAEDNKVESPEQEGSTVKTAAQKRKEKKEREKQKKLAQNAQERGKQKEHEGEEPEEKPIGDISKKETEAIEEEENEIHKKKEKKKKGGEEDKKDKKKPGKKQLEKMQEHLKKMKEEEERLKREEEERQRALEEAERLRQEQLRLEQERKERKKQKEKERRERLKAEGKLLSKAEKQKRERAQATLASLKAQGIEVPEIGEKRDRKPRYDKKRTKKKSEENVEASTDKEIKLELEPPQSLEKNEPIQVEVTVENEKPAQIKEIKEVEEDVKEAWDASSSDEDENSHESHLSANDAKHDKSVASGDETEDENEDSDSEASSEEESSQDELSKKQDTKIAMQRIQKHREEAEKKRDVNKLRSPIICVLGHVDTGKTKILDKIRHTNVQDCEAGGITQQIGATMVPREAIMEQCKMAKSFSNLELKLPGLLIIDTPGHESFSNLRSRGSSQCDIAILVVDIMHGLEPQTIESINILKKRRTPFVVALNKIDRLYDWKKAPNRDIQEVLKGMSRNTKSDFEERTKNVQLQFSEQGLNTALYYENPDVKSYVSLVPTSAITGDGMGNLMTLIIEYSQSLLAKKLAFSEELQATVLEVKAIPGLGTTIDVILINGRLKEGDTMIVAGQEGPIVTQIRSLLMPEPLRELRVKNPYKEYKIIEGAQGVKIAAKELEKAIAGLPVLVADNPDEIEILKDEVDNTLRETIKSFKPKTTGVCVQASTLGSLEALLEFLTSSKIQYSNVKVGPVTKKDVMKASAMLQHDPQYALIMAFDVKVERDAEELAEEYGVKIFTANIIYHLFDKFTAYQEEFLQKKRDEYKHIAVFPCKLRILPQFLFNYRDPIVVGVSIEAGIIKEGTPLCVPSKDYLEIGRIATIEVNHKQIDVARKGQEVCIKIEPIPGETPELYGRHFDYKDMLVSKISRESIEACKSYFRNDLTKSDWQLIIELKKVFNIM